MARNGKARAEKRKAESFAPLVKAATAKFDLFKELNSKIDAKSAGASSHAEKIRIENERAVARTAKAKIVARQSFATTDEIGAGSSKGMFFAGGERTNQVRGKEKIRKTASSPSYNGKKSKIKSEWGKEHG
ncbi:MAG: hypothetical protein ACRCVX_16000 [Shewanella sp.]